MHRTESDPVRERQPCPAESDRGSDNEGQQ